MSTPPGPLDPRVVALRAAGRSWAQVAEELGITVSAARWGAGYRYKSGASGAPMPPVAAIPDDFEVSSVSTEVAADGTPGKQWLGARPARTTRAGVHDAIPDGHAVTGVSTLVDGSGNVSAQWIKTDVEKKRRLDAVLA